MGIQTVVVFIGLVFALIVGVLAGTWDGNSTVAGWLAIGLVPAMWGVLHLAEWLTGRELWHYTRAYPDFSRRAADSDIDGAGKV